MSTLPGEATALAKVGEYIASPSVQQFLEEFVSGGRLGVERFEQILQGLGYVMFLDGLQRPGLPRAEMSLEHKAALLHKEVDLFLQGASALSDVIRGDK